MPDAVLGRSSTGGDIGAEAAEERQRLTDAAARLATERGVRALDAQAVAGSCGLTVEDLERHFGGIDQCLLAAYDSFVEEVVAHIVDACHDCVEWSEKIRLAIAAIVETVLELEPVARVFAVEAVRTGPAALERRSATIERAALRLKHGRLLYPGAADLPEGLERTLVGGLVTTVTGHLLREERDGLARAGDEAVEILLAPYVGAARARFVAGGRPRVCNPI
jgi:AcrR family transcriptional regulator